ncbi:uncharacterized protein N7477_002210 [Penicillium maclennaniae]|uniref:uncharacterized protein n=1 Tax=Penicillium maclennaniae TaxID=1343394 RepID=UPI002541787F|nr:uncharacterized protein N7477_002210 [Penicillium maclennaniae]KAJ5676577.1 hypothetical protein N7477_002210 [Penicillium maclennaniae]
MWRIIFRTLILIELATVDSLLGALGSDRYSDAQDGSSGLVALVEEILKVTIIKIESGSGQSVSDPELAAVDTTTGAGTGVVLIILDCGSGNDDIEESEDDGLGKQFEFSSRLSPSIEIIGSMFYHMNVKHAGIVIDKLIDWNYGLLLST